MGGNNQRLFTHSLHESNLDAKISLYLQIQYPIHKALFLSFSKEE